MNEIKKILQLITALLDNHTINAARCADNAADEIACKIDDEMTKLDLFSEDGDGNTVLDLNKLNKLAAAQLGRIKSEKRARASRANGAKSPGGKKGARKPEGELTRSGLWRRRQREKKMSD